MKYAFIDAHRPFFSIRSMCRVFKVHPSGFYSWLKQPLSDRKQQDRRQTLMLKEAWEDSGKVYGYRKLHSDLRDQGEEIGLNRAERLARMAGIKAQIGYKRRPSHYGGRPAIVTDNHLDRQFNPGQPNRIWVTDITYIRTHEGWGYLCVVVDLFSRRVVG